MKTNYSVATKHGKSKNSTSWIIMKKSTLLVSQILLTLAAFTGANGTALAEHSRLFSRIRDEGRPHYVMFHDRVKFDVRLVPSCRIWDLNAEAARTRAVSVSANWDDKWYVTSLQPATGQCLLASWYNVSRNNFGWAAIRSTPTRWESLSSLPSSRWYWIQNGEQAKYTFWIEGQRVDIDFLNPQGSGYTDNDILLGFGY